MLGPNSEISVQRQATIDQLADRFEREFRDGSAPRIEDFLPSEASELRPHLLRELLALELELRRNAGEQPAMDEYLQRFPEDRAIVESVFMPATEMASTMDQTKDTELEPAEEGPLPERLGRYVIKRQLGKGGFGVVYLAHDPQLDRSRRSQSTQTRAIQNTRASRRVYSGGAYDRQAEAPVASNDSRRTGRETGSRISFRSTSRERIWRSGLPSTNQRLNRLSKYYWAWLKRWAMRIAQRLTHCDLKLANVLMDQQDQPHVADFGLAVHESARLDRKGPRFGTPPMMAPEQVRGEGHRLDGRTDIWALGVMMYQMLVSQRPFTATEQAELFNEIETLDPRPPRQIDRSVPRELERICLKCLSKRRTERYNTTDDLREDLQLWLTGNASTEVPQSSTVPASAARASRFGLIYPSSQ